MLINSFARNINYDPHPTLRKITSQLSVILDCIIQWKLKLFVFAFKKRIKPKEKYNFLFEQ